MSNTVDKSTLIRYMDLHRIAKSSDDSPASLAILIEHGDGTDYTVNAVDRRETPEHLTALLAAVGRGANTMIRALRILRSIGYVDMRPITLSGRHIIFGLDRVALELEILENNDGGIDCGISVIGEDRENVEAIERVLEEKGIDLI